MSNKIGPAMRRQTDADGYPGDDAVLPFVEPGFRTLVKQPYEIVPCSPEEREYEHCFCGPQRIHGAECPNCRIPFVQFFSIDTRDPRLGLTECPFRFLPLVSCVRCDLCQDQFYYQVLPPDGGIRVLRYREGNARGANPFDPDPYPEYFPGAPVRLRPLTKPEQWCLNESNRLSREAMLAASRFEFDKDDALYAQFQELGQRYAGIIDEPDHQIGGEPLLAENWDCWPHTCPLCGRDMVFLASFEDTNTDPRGFSGHTGGQYLFTYCRTCHAIGAAALE